MFIKADRSTEASKSFIGSLRIGIAKIFYDDITVKAFFISKQDLIASKLAAGRLRDLADVEDIREAEVSQGELGDGE